ncbi:MAG: DUF6946 family protein [Alphaproteobacteria bacterium]
MNPIYKPTKSPDDWREFLADPVKHWRTGYSAKSMAYSWEEAKGIPKEVSETIETAFGHIPEPLIIIPEFKVPLKGGNRDSQNDAFLLARVGDQTASIMIEGKVNESFGPRISEWFKDPSDGKTERLKFLCETLGTFFPPPEHLRYQLFHRTASAILTANRFKTDIAIMLVQSFSQEHMWWDDFKAFGEYMGVKSALGELCEAPTETSVPTYIGWVTGHARFLKK